MEVQVDTVGPTRIDDTQPEVATGAVDRDRFGLVGIHNGSQPTLTLPPSGSDLFGSEL